jgi:ribosomal-protein-alanine N-acetyltransferase
MKYKDFRLETDRLLLRLFTSDDVEDCYSMLSLEEVVKNVNLQVQTLDEVRVFMSEMIEGYNLNTPEQLVKFTVAVVWKETGRVIGWVGLSPIKFDPGSIEIYYGFHPDFWGAGIATEAATAMLRFGFAELNLLQIVGLTHPHNHASSHVLEKIGRFMTCPKSFDISRAATIFLYRKVISFRYKTINRIKCNDFSVSQFR